MQSTDIREQVLQWARANDNVRAAILTSSRVSPFATPDALSDYDIELYVRDLIPFMTDDWLAFRGVEIMVRWPRTPQSEGDPHWLTRLVQYMDGERIDFQITDHTSIAPTHYDSGYEVLLDKDGLTVALMPPTYAEYIIQRPTEEQYLDCVNAFFWDATYIPKNLLRDELYYAKFIHESVIRFSMLQPMIEWYIAVQHDWNISTNKYGRYFKRYLDAETWAALESTFAGASIENNWQAFFNLLALFRKLAKAVGEHLGYAYPEQTDTRVTAYCEQLYAQKGSFGT